MHPIFGFLHLASLPKHKVSHIRSCSVSSTFPKSPPRSANPPQPSESGTHNSHSPFQIPHPPPPLPPASPLLSTPPPRPNLAPHPPQTPLIPSSNTTLPRNPILSPSSPPKAPAPKTSPLSLREENDHVRNQAPRARSSLISPYPGPNPKSSSNISPKSQRQTPLTIRPTTSTTTLSLTQLFRSHPPRAYVSSFSAIRLYIAIAIAITISQ